MPKVSVVIPCYNQARYLPEAMESVAGQTYSDFEIIIVNDGSSDDTREVAEGLAEKYQGLSIRIINQPNQGPATARNCGIDAAMGEYILPLDADDIILPELLEETVKVLDSDPRVSIAYSDLRYFGEVPDDRKDLVVGHDYNFRLLLKGNHITGCCLFRKKAWEDVGGYKRDTSPSVGYEDWEYWITLGEAGHFGRRVKNPLFLYRLKENSRYTESLKNHEKICYEMRKMHRTTFYPFIGRYDILFHIANLLKLVGSTARNSVIKYLYGKHPDLYRFLKAKRDSIRDTALRKCQ